MTLNSLPNNRKDRNRIVSGIFRAFTLMLLIAAFGFTSLQAQTVGYVVNQVVNTVTVVDISTNTIVATIPVGNLPQRVVPAPNGVFAYVSSSSPGAITVIDATTNTVVATIPIPGTRTLTDLALTPDSATLYAADFLSNTVTVIDTATNTVAGSPIAVPDAHLLAMTPDGAHLYVGQISVNTLSIIDTATNTLEATSIPLGAQPLRLAITPDGKRLYAACQGGVVVVDTTSNTVVTTIPVGILDDGLAVITPDASTLYAADIISHTLFVIDTATNTLVTSFLVGPSPESIAVTPDGALAYVPSLSAGTAVVIDTTTNAIVGSPVPVGVHAVDMKIFNPTTLFAAFAIDNLNISSQGFHEQGDFTLGANSQGVDLAHQPVTLTIGSFSFTIPAGSFRQVGGNMHFVLNATINGLQVNFNLKAANGSSSQFTYVVNVNGVDLTAQPDPVTVGLKIGENVGTTTVQF